MVTCGCSYHPGFRAFVRGRVFLSTPGIWCTGSALKQRLAGGPGKKEWVYYSFFMKKK